MLKKIIFAAAHLIFWSVFIALSLKVGFKVDEGWDFFKEFYTIYIFQLIWAVTAVYIFYFYFAKILFDDRKPYKYLIISVISSPVISGVFFFLIFSLHPKVKLMQNLNLYTGSTITTFILTQLGTLLRAFVNWYNQQEQKADLEKTNLRNELAMLKSQVNPHFLFNTLNNIDSLIRADSEQASKAIIQLSEMLRYMLYETDQEYVSLGQEKKYLEDLIALQKLRHKSPDAIEFHTSISDKEVKIIPFLFLPFVENAFKYATKKDNEPLVNIELCDDGQQLIFTCRNYFIPNQNNHDPAGGLGISNAKRRLHAYYKDCHNLQIEKKQDLYSIELRIKHND